MVNKDLQSNNTPSKEIRPDGRPACDYVIEGQTFAAPSLQAGLYVVATPIGNMADITVRALQTLARADLIACEDTRKSGQLMQRYGIGGRLFAYHDHSGPQTRASLLDHIAKGQVVALISDAGTPLIADPGYKLVVAARQAGHEVFAIPGPSALVAALSIGGLPTDRFSFVGFLPAKEKARGDAIADLKALPGTLALYEAPARLAASLQALADGLGADREACVCRELTKRFETVNAGTLGGLAKHYGEEEAPRGEIVVLIAPSQHQDIGQDAIDAALRAALQSERVKDAAALVADAYGLSKRDLYQRALTLSKDPE